MFAFSLKCEMVMFINSVTPSTWRLWGKMYIGEEYFRSKDRLIFTEKTWQVDTLFSTLSRDSTFSISCKLRNFPQNKIICLPMNHVRYENQFIFMVLDKQRIMALNIAFIILWSVMNWFPNFYNGKKPQSLARNFFCCCFRIE